MNLPELPDTSQLDSELEELMEQSPEEDAEADEPEAEPVDPLEVLLQESLADKREVDRAKAARERMKRGGNGYTERIADEALIRQWEEKHEWQAQANVAMFSVQMCACTSHRFVFEQLMTRQVHRHMRLSQRWVKTETSQAALPNETVIRNVHVPMCAVCAESKGWSLASATTWEN
jgi:hypothetical protein